MGDTATRTPANAWQDAIRDAKNAGLGEKMAQRACAIHNSGDGLSWEESFIQAWEEISQEHTPTPSV